MNERLPFLRDKTQKLTTSPGVYIMKNTKGEIIYIGKAKNLKNRVTSYFRENPDHTPKTAKMVSHVFDYDFIVTDTEYEALVLECSLIKQHKPKYNILLKDDKGYHYIKISSEPYPRITAEKQMIDGIGKYMGPYTSSFVTKQTVNEVNAVFKLPECKKKFPQEIGKKRPCLNFYINKCMGVCIGRISQDEYAKIIAQAEDYMKNGSIDSAQRMQNEMEEASETLDFERAAILRDRISAITKATDSQKVVDSELLDTDIIACVQDAGNSCIAVLSYKKGRLFDKSSFILDSDNSPQYIIGEFMVQYYQDRDIPRTIVIEQDIPDKDIITDMLTKKCGHAVKILHRQKGNMLRFIMLAKNNASEYLSIKVGRTGKEIIALEELAKLLGMENPPKYIEAYDISNLSSSAMVAGMVVFEDGRPLKKAYKRFSIKDVAIQNDYACMREVLERRFLRYKNNSDDEGFSRMPDLVFVDGGKGQVNAVEPMLREMGITVPVYGIVKDNKHSTRAIASGGAEILVTSTKSAFMLITRIQDEMHRFAITYQRSKHTKNSYELEITKINGIGVKKAQKLIIAFKTREALKNASVDELAKAAGVNMTIAKELYEFIQNL